MKETAQLMAALAMMSNASVGEGFDPEQQHKLVSWWAKLDKDDRIKICLIAKKLATEMLTEIDFEQNMPSLQQS